MSTAFVTIEFDSVEKAREFMAFMSSGGGEDMFVADEEAARSRGEDYVYAFKYNFIKLRMRSLTKRGVLVDEFEEVVE